MLHLIELNRVPIFEQLQLEEALLRADTRNLCIMNHGSTRAIVMGQSSHPQDLLDVERVQEDEIPVIKRFSGGGTVIVDEETLFISFIFAKDFLPICPFPEPILRWSAELYKTAWDFPDFALTEHDYTLGALKCGGNAQYLSKDRWVHHTSFLWDYSDKNMEYLLLPKKRPKYREERAHGAFLCRLSEKAASKEGLIAQLKNELVKRFDICEVTLEGLSDVLGREHRKSTHLVELR